MSEMKKENVYRVSLPSGKVIHMREMKMKYEDLAMQAVGTRGKGNEAYQQKLMADELMKILLVDVDGKVLAPADREKLNDILDYRDIVAVRKIMLKITGSDEGESYAPNLEVVSSSGNQ